MDRVVSMGGSILLSPARRTAFHFSLDRPVRSKLHRTCAHACTRPICASFRSLHAIPQVLPSHLPTQRMLSFWASNISLAWLVPGPASLFSFLAMESRSGNVNSRRCYSSISTASLSKILYDFALRLYAGALQVQHAFPSFLSHMHLRSN